MNSLTIGSLTLRFRSRRGCEDLTTEFMEVIRKYKDSIRAALRDMDGTPTELDVVVTHRIDEAGRIAGKFSPFKGIALNKEWFMKLKQSCVDVEAAHYEMMRIFLHELAHWRTRDEDEADEWASEWQTA